MATTKRRKSRRPTLGREARRRIVIGAILFASVLLLLMPPSVTRGIRLYAGPVFYPLQGVTEGLLMDIGQSSPSAGGPGLAPAEWSRVRQENTDLEEALAKATAVIDQYDKRVRDLALIREGLDGLPCRLIPASVLPVRSVGGRAVAHLAEGSERGVAAGGVVVMRDIDRGTREQVEKGQPVLAAMGLVGIVDDVGPRMSTVRLVTDPRTRLMVQVIMRRGEAWRAGPTAVAEGTPDGAGLRLKGISRGTDIAAGDYVVTSPSAQSPVPPYLVVGRIDRCDLPRAAVFLDVSVKPRVAPSEVDRVYVLAPALPLAP